MSMELAFDELFRRVTALERASFGGARGHETLSSFSRGLKGLPPLPQTKEPDHVRPPREEAMDQERVDKLKIEALRLATQTKHWDGTPVNEVVKLAEEYFAFLVADPQPKPPDQSLEAAE